MPDLIVIGGGPAGLAAACSAWEDGARDIVIVERDRELGGILNQCIHSGFGLQYFKEELTGPEYAGRFVKMLQSTGVHVKLDTMVLDVTAEKEVHTISAAEGYRILRAKAVILAMGCRERARGAVCIPGSRPAGIFTAGAAQRYVNIEGHMVGRRIVILGSGDIGLIMARRMTLEGAKVLACVEVMPYSGGLTRNIVQCLQDFGIPLYLSHTIVEIRGNERVEQATIAAVDADRKPIPGTEKVFDCDTVLLSVGLIPENELSRKAGIAIDRRTNGPVVYENMETSVPGIFACGNVVHVHDLVDYVTEESRRAGAAAAEYLARGEKPGNGVLELAGGDGVAYTVPQKIRRSGAGKSVDVFFRVSRVCGKSRISIRCGGRSLAEFGRERLAPGEMEHVALAGSLLEKCGSNHLSVCVKEDSP